MNIMALTALRDDIKSGATIAWGHGGSPSRKALPTHWHEAMNAYLGSLDAAHALHNAVLPGWDAHIWLNEAVTVESPSAEGVERIMQGENNVQISASLPVGHAMVSRIRTGKAWADLSASMGYVPAPSKQAPKSGRTAFRGGS